MASRNSGNARMEGNNPDGYKVNEERQSQIVRKKGNNPKEIAVLCLNACLG